MLVVFVGPPGAGKGTQAKLIHQKLEIPHISTGDMLREALLSDSILSRKVKEIMKVGNLVPDDIVLELVRERISRKDASFRTRRGKMDRYTML
jgi:adenylate kinase